LTRQYAAHRVSDQAPPVAQSGKSNNIQQHTQLRSFPKSIVLSVCIEQDQDGFPLSQE